MIRTLQPIDFWGLARLTSRARSNEARPREKLTGGSADALPPYAIFTEWLPARRRRHVWIASEEREIRALASVRPRAGKGAWEVDALLLEPGREALCQELLERLSMAAGAQGVQRVFLRLCSRSPLLQEATAVGFLAYQKEHLFQAPGLQEDATVPSAPSEVRPRSAADDHPLFRLYQAATSASVRSAEGMTLQEWQDARETRWGQGSEHVYEREGQLVGWLRLTEAEKMGYLDALVRPDDGAVAAALVDLARASLGNKAAVVSLVREGDAVLEATLRERGFEPVEEYVSLVKQVAARVRAPCLIPAGA